MGPNGRKMLGQQPDDVMVQDTFVHCLFINKLFEFVHLRTIIFEAFDRIFSNHEDLNGIKFGWRYCHSIKKIILDN